MADFGSSLLHFVHPLHAFFGLHNAGREDGGRNLTSSTPALWQNQPHGQRQVVGPTLKLESFLTRKEETEEGYRAPRPVEVSCL